MFQLIALLCLCFCHLVQANSIPYPDFKESIFLKGIDGRLSRYQRTYDSLDLKYVQMFENIYKRNIAEAEAEPFNQKGRIPKIVHQIWLGGQVPEAYRSWMSTWANLHGWTYKLWTDEEVKTLPMHNRDLFNKTTNMGEKSDMLRLEILLKYGGVYVDTDLQCIRPEFLEELHRKFDFYIGVEPLFHGIIQEYKLFKFCNAIIGAAPQHTLVKDLIIHLKANYLAYENQSVFQKTGPNYITRIACQYELRGAHQQRNMYLPSSFFYPFSVCETKDYINCPEKIIDLFPEAIGIHYWMGSWRVPQQSSEGKKP